MLDSLEKRIDKKCPRLIDRLIFCLPIVVLILFKWELLVSGRVMFSMDAFNNFTYYNYFISNFNGVIPPLWNPLLFSGEPFYYYIIYMGWATPGAILSVLIHHYFPSLSLMHLFEVDLFIKFLIFYTGMAAFLRSLKLGRLGTFLLLLVSALGTVSYSMYHSPLFLLIATYVPWILYFLKTWLLDKKKWALVGAAFCISSQVLLYIPVYFTTYLTLLGVGFVVEIFLKKGLPKFKNISFHFKDYFGLVPVLPSLVILALTVPSLRTLYLENKEVYASARVNSNTHVGEEGISVELNEAKDPGTTISWSDFVKLSFFEPLDVAAESPLILGFVTFLLGVIGFLYGTMRGRITFSIGTLILILLSTGVKGKLAPLVFKTIPVFRYIRSLSPFIVFIFISLIILAAYFLKEIKKTSFRDGFIERVLSFGFFVYLLLAVSSRWNGLSQFFWKARVGVVLLSSFIVSYIWFSEKLQLSFFKFSKNLYFIWTYLKEFPLYFLRDIFYVGVMNFLVLFFILTRFYRFDYYFTQSEAGPWPSFFYGLSLYVFYLIAKKRVKEIILLGIIFLVSGAHLSHRACLHEWGARNSKNAKCYNMTLMSEKLSSLRVEKLTYHKTRSWVPPRAYFKDLRQDPYVSGMGTSYFFNSEAAYWGHSYVIRKTYLNFLVDHIKGFSLKEPISEKKLGKDLKDTLGISSDKIELLPKKPGTSYRVLDYTPNRISIETETSEPGSLVYKDSAHRYWGATVDGGEVPIETWRGLFKKVPIPKGKSLVVFEFKPFGFLVSFYWVLFCSLVVAGFCVAEFWNFKLKTIEEEGG